MSGVIQATGGGADGEGVIVTLPNRVCRCVWKYCKFIVWVQRYTLSNYFLFK